MARRLGRGPVWREGPATPGTYRELFSYDPGNVRHPARHWVDMLQEDLALPADAFTTLRETGDTAVRAPYPSRLDPADRAALAAIVGEENAADDDVSRVRYGHGKSIDENLALRRAGARATPDDLRALPDLVLHPRDKDDVVAIVRYCSANAIPIVPYGGGSGVVLGTRSERGGVVLALGTHMNRLLAIDEANQTALVQPGLLTPAYEDALNHAPERFGAGRAYTGGHFPQSFDLASVGGWINALGAGQASTYYGDAYDLVVAQEVVTPAGVVRTQAHPASATGPKLNDILKGSEGTFGVLVEATLRIYRHMPGNTRRFAFLFPDFAAAVDATREIAQGEFGLPAILRISDGEETERGLRVKGFDRGIPRRILGLRGYRPGQSSLMIGTAEGERGFARHVARMASGVARDHGGRTLTSYATRAWERGRYSDVLIREDLLDHGILIDTLETSVTWESLHRVHDGVREFVTARPHTVCMTHASHVYPQGTNLYVILALRPESPDEYTAFRGRIVERIVELGGSVSHHHGVGRMFAPWLERQLGPEQLDALRALKRHFDPAGIMNPGATLALGPSQPRVATDDETPDR